MDTTLAQNFLQDDYALFQGHTLTSYHAANFIGHLDRPPIVGDEQDAQDRFEIINTLRPHRVGLCRGDVFAVASDFIYKSSTM
jgi:hypothetical protein